MASPSTQRLAWALGATQCVYWGVLYYAYSALLVPMAEDLRLSAAVVAGAFSVGLATSALLAPPVGRLLDRGHGAAVLAFGGWMTPLLLVGWSSARSASALYAAWVALGASMAASLYEPLFALLTRAHPDSGERMRSIATVSVLGGLASTLFLPVAGWAAQTLGWRWGLRFLAGIWLLATVVSRPTRAALARADRRPQQPSTLARSTARRGDLLLVGAPFVVATFAGMAVTTVVVPMLLARGVSLARASVVLAMLGVMQLPGRLWFLRGRAMPPFARLLIAPLLLQAAGLVGLATGANVVVATASVALFGIGSGLHTVTRPYVVPYLFGVSAAGAANGWIARAQGAARALGPVTAAMAYRRMGAPSTFLALAVLLCALLPVAATLSRREPAAG